MNFKKFLEHTHNDEKDDNRIIIQKQPQAYHKIIQDLPLKKNIISSKCILIDSRHRNKESYPNTNNFIISFNPDPTYLGASINTNIKNITKINIDNVVLPKVALDYSYIILKINELHNNDIFSTNGFADDAFAILIPKKHNNTSDFIHCEITHNCHNFITPIANLKKFTISFYDPNNNLINFGADHIGSIKDSVQTMIMLNIEYLERDNNLRTQII